MLQITAPISGGSSGGALLNERGQVIGVVAAYYVDGQNLNLAIASNAVTELIEHASAQISLEELYLKQHPQIEFDDYYVHVRVLPVSSEETANDLYEEWLSGEKTDDNMIALMNKYSKGKSEGWMLDIVPGDLSGEIEQWCFDPARRVGEVGIIKGSDHSCMVCYFSGVSERKLLTVGVSADYPPFEYIDGYGDIVGADVLAIYKIAEEIGYEFEVVDIPFGELMTALINGAVDCIVGLTETPDRNLVANASVPLFDEDEGFVVYVNEDDRDLLAEINRAIKLLQRDGTMDSIVEYYLDYPNFDKMDQAAP